MKAKTYADIPVEFSTIENSKVVLIPVPYDGTSTWQKGADKGPDAFLEASANMELYDIETDTEVYRRACISLLRWRKIHRPKPWWMPWRRPWAGIWTRGNSSPLSGANTASASE